MSSVIIQSSSSSNVSSAICQCTTCLLGEEQQVKSGANHHWHMRQSPVVLLKDASSPLLFSLYTGLLLETQLLQLWNAQSHCTTRMQTYSTCDQKRWSQGRCVMVYYGHYSGWTQSGGSCQYILCHSCCAIIAILFKPCSLHVCSQQF